MKEVYVRIKGSQAEDISVGCHCDTLGETHLIESVARLLWSRENTKHEIKELDGFIARPNEVTHLFDKVIITLGA